LKRLQAGNLNEVRGAQEAIQYHPPAHRQIQATRTQEMPVASFLEVPLATLA
jgi:hypothetical protein